VLVSFFDFVVSVFLGNDSASLGIGFPAFLNNLVVSSSGVALPQGSIFVYAVAKTQISLLSCSLLGHPCRCDGSCPESC